MVILDGMSFAERLKEARTRAQVTQQDIADACGITTAAISKWENGKTEDVFADHIFCVADFLRVDPRWLATGRGPTPRPRTALDEIVAGLEHLPAEQQEAVRALVQSLKR